MEKNELILFTNRYPYAGYEYFVDKEMKYLSAAFDRIVIYPYNAIDGEMPYFDIPENVTVRILSKAHANESIKRTILKNIFRVLKWYIFEIVSSPHRLKYFTSFSWNANHLLDCIRLSEKLKNEDLSETAILYSYWFDEWADALAWGKQSWAKNRLFARTHGFDFDEQQQSRGYHPFRRIVWKYFDKIYPISQYGVNYLKQKRFDMSKVQLSRLGVEDLGMGVLPYLPEIVFVSCSSFYPVKRVKLIADILRHIKVPYKWVHFGGGEFMEQNVKLISDILPENNFEFKGMCKNAEVMNYLKNNPVDLFLNVSELEGLPVSLMEAISFGIPIMGCNTCGVPEIVNQSTGILIDVNFDTDSVADKIIQFIDKSGRNAEYRNNIRKFYQNNFSAGTNAREFIKEIKKKNK